MGSYTGSTAAKQPRAQNWNLFNETGMDEKVEFTDIEIEKNYTNEFIIWLNLIDFSFKFLIRKKNNIYHISNSR